MDVSCASELRDAINAALEGEATQVTVDLAEVPYIDSTGIGVLVGAAHRAARGRRRPSRSPTRSATSRVLDMLGVSGELGIDEAPRSVHGRYEACLELERPSF